MVSDERGSETNTDWTIIRTLRSSRLALPLGLLALIAAVVLHAILTRPPASPVAAEPTPPSRPARRPDLEKTPLSYFSDYWLQLGDLAREKLVLVGAPRTPAIRIAPGLALSSIDATDQLAEAPASPRLLAADAARGLALFAVDDAALPFERADPAGIHPGALVAAVSLGPEGALQIVPGHVVAAPAATGAGSAEDTLELSLALPRSAAIAAVVDVDGRLVGAALAAPRGVRVLSAATLLRVTGQLRARPVCRAIEVATVPAAVRELLGFEGGVLVERVQRVAFEREPALRPGDILLEWSGQPLASADAFARLYDQAPAGLAVRAVSRRGGQRIALQLLMPARDCRPAVRPPLTLARAGMTLRFTGAAGPRSGGFEVLQLAAAGPARAAGLAVGDLIVSADAASGEAPVRRVLEGYEQRPRALLLHVRRGDRATLLALGPASGG